MNTLKVQLHSSGPIPLPQHLAYVARGAFRTKLEAHLRSQSVSACWVPCTDVSSEADCVVRLTRVNEGSKMFQLLGIYAMKVEAEATFTHSGRTTEFHVVGRKKSENLDRLASLCEAAEDAAHQLGSQIGGAAGEVQPSLQACAPQVTVVGSGQLTEKEDDNKLVPLMNNELKGSDDVTGTCWFCSQRPSQEKSNLRKGLEKPWKIEQKKTIVCPRCATCAAIHDVESLWAIPSGCLGLIVMAGLFFWLLSYVVGVFADASGPAGVRLVLGAVCTLLALLIFKLGISTSLLFFWMIGIYITWPVTWLLRKKPIILLAWLVILGSIVVGSLVGGWVALLLQLAFKPLGRDLVFWICAGVAIGVCFVLGLTWAKRKFADLFVSGWVSVKPESYVNEYPDVKKLMRVGWKATRSAGESTGTK